jgi:hypothetical protein
MVDAQLTNARVLKPFENFERVYQGQSALTPIAFPGLRDKRAEDHAQGIDPNLLAGIPVPEGARVLLWLPMCFASNDESAVDIPYSYRLIWRFQNLSAYRDPAARSKRAPYHFPRQSPGAPDTTVIPFPGSPRVTIPASWHVIAHEEAEPLTGPTALNIRVENIIPRLDSLGLFVQPLLASGQPAVVEQGVADPASIPGAVMPIFIPFWTDAEGDELIIVVTRTDATAQDTWDFTDPAKDLAFSNIYGTGNGSHPSFRDLGIYLQTGTTP